MAIDPNIFFQGAALRQANDARLQNTFETLAKTFMDRRAQQLKMEQDPDYIGSKIAAGQEITPQQQAIMRYRDTEQRVKNAQIDPNTGTMVLGPSLFDSLAPKSTDMPYQVQSPLFKSPSSSFAPPAAPMNGMINGAGSPMPPLPKTAGGFVNDLGGDLMVPPVGDNYAEVSQMSPDQRLAARTNPSSAALPTPQNPLQEKMNYQAQLDIGKEAAKAEKEREIKLKDQTKTDMDTLPILRDMLVLNNKTVNMPYAGTGIAQFGTRALAPKASMYMDLLQQNRLDLAAPLAKQLGVNPTDKDFQATLGRIFDANATKESRAAQIQNLIDKIERRNNILSRGYEDTSQGTRKNNTPTLPRIGDIDSGYQYMGGDPSQQSSWKKVAQ